MLAADTERAALLAEAETAEEPGRIAEIHDRLATIAADAAPARAATILAGLGFDQAAQLRPLDDYSGGWRMRVALAACLFAEPDLLLLDEPSNHLDLEARLWLESFLAAFPGTLILVSHDRELLNAVAEEIVHIDGGKLSLYRGNYDRFEQARAERQTLRAA
ncbi:MAG: ATP-binding cassette, subfamily F, member 3, partial [bacterium]